MELVSYRSSVITNDTRLALGELEKAASKLGGVKIVFGGVSHEESSWEGVRASPGPLNLPEPLSMRPTGREVYLSLEGLENRFEALASLWALAVPLGFTPWNRYPVPGPNDSVFHYFGPWRMLGDFLHGEGRGEFAWPSICCAAQSQVKRWEGPKKVECEVQMHLHRLGVHCGTMDGMISSRTLTALKALGLGGVSLEDCLASLADMVPPSKSPGPRDSGFLVLKGVKAEAFSSGGVHSLRTPTGYSLTIDGPGRLVVEVG